MSALVVAVEDIRARCPTRYSCADRELLAELARMNSDVVPLAMRMMEHGATGEHSLVKAWEWVAGVLRVPQSRRSRRGRHWDLQ